MRSQLSAQRFNGSRFGRFINSNVGRAFRLTAGVAFASTAFTALPIGARIALVAWSVLPLTAGAFDICWISAALGGPLPGRRIRAANDSTHSVPSR